MSERLLRVGAVLGAHGLKGTISVYSDTRPSLSIAGYSCWYLGASELSAQVHTVTRCWQHGKGVLATLDGIDTCDAAEALKKMSIFVPRDEVEVDEHEYLWQDLIGCEVRSEQRTLGAVRALESYGAQDILCVRTLDDADIQGEWLLPFTEDVVLSIDLEKSMIEIQLLDGMDACFTPKS